MPGGHTANGPITLSDAGPRVDQDLLDFIATQMTELHVPGVAVGVAHAREVATAGLGITSVRAPVPVDADTLFQIGSITKPVVGTAVMSLVEEGKLDVDAPVRTYLPDFRVADADVTARVTLRHLMTHSVGWGGEDLFDDHGWGDDALARIVESMRDLPQPRPLGEMASYNNSGFYPLGRILEVADGLPFEQVIRRRVFLPLGMSSACFFAHEAILRRHAVGHAVADRGLQVAAPWAMPRATNPAGGVVCSVRDLLRFGLFHLGLREPSSAPIGPALRGLMQEPALPNDRFRNGGREPGLTWWLEELGGTRIVGHSGGANGQPAYLRMVPSAGFALVLLTNGAGGGTLATRVAGWAFDRYLHLSSTVPAAEPGSFGNLDDAVGVFQGDDYRFTVSVADDRLHVVVETLRDWLEDMDPSFAAMSESALELIPTGPDTVATGPLEADSPRADFLRDATGRVMWFRYHGRATPRVAST